MKTVRCALLLAALLAVAIAGAQTAPAAGDDSYLGSISITAANYAPQNWAFCDGQLLAISYYQELYSVIGTTYGGDGVVSFALPDLRGRMPIGMGRGSGLTNRSLGAMGGLEYISSGTTGSGVNIYYERDQAQQLHNMPPFQVLQYIICLEGLYPQRQ